MTYMPDYMTPQPPLPGRTGLIVFGIISILIGALAVGVSLILALAPRTSSIAPSGTPDADLASVIVGVLSWAAIAAVFIWVGIGSCRCRRWVRPLVLCLAWPWMFLGLVNCIEFIPMLGEIGRPQSTSMPAQSRPTTLLAMGTSLAIMYVVLPLAYIGYYQRSSVRETLNLCDPALHRRRHCPTPVLGLSLWLLIIGLGSIARLQERCVPLFGTYVTGLPAVGLTLGVAAAMVLAAWFCYRLRPVGWWIALVTTVTCMISTLLTFWIGGIMEFYRRSGWTNDQMAFLEQHFVRKYSPLLLAAVYGAASTMYLLYVRRCFVGSDEFKAVDTQAVQQT